MIACLMAEKDGRIVSPFLLYMKNGSSSWFISTHFGHNDIPKENQKNGNDVLLTFFLKMAIAQAVFYVPVPFRDRVC